MNFFKPQKINSSLTLICEAVGSQTHMMGLVEGTEKALVFDTGVGLSGDLDKYLKTLTDKPVECVVAHADPDHCGAAALFDSVYMSEKDKELLPWSLNAEKRLKYIADITDNNSAVMNFAGENLVKAASFNFKNLEDGHIFDLGGTKLLALAFPGHSQGSFCLINKAEGYALVSDSILAAPWLWLKRCPSLETWRNSAVRFLQTAGNIDLYSGHSRTKLPDGLLEDLIRGADEVLAGKTSGDTQFTFPYSDNISLEAENARVHSCGIGQIVYNIHNIKD